LQAGFGVLEAGAIRKKNIANILFKNLLDASAASITFYLLGYGFAYGKTADGMIGTR
jgi:Amt family ammonium transporter